MVLDDEVKKLVDWKNPPTLSDLKTDYQDGVSDHTTHKNNVDKYLKLIDGKLDIKIPKGRSKVQPKLIRKQAEWRYAALEEPFLSADKLFTVNGVTYQDVEAAKQNEMILNKQFKVDIDRIKLINKYIRTAVNTGTVILKVSWYVEEGIVREEVEVPVYASPEESVMYIQDMVNQGQMSQEEAMAMIESGEPIQLGTEMQVVEKQTLVKNCPVVEVRDSRQVIIDPTCEGDISQAKFIIDRFTSDLSTLKKDGRYSNLEKIVIPEGDTEGDDNYPHRNTSFVFKDKPRQKLTVYEYWGYWDINGDGIVKPIVASWVGNTIIRLEENPYPDKKLPFVLVQYLPPNSATDIYGDPDASLLEDNQNIIGAITRGMIDLLGKSANSQQGIRKDALDPTNKLRFINGEDYEFNPHVTPDNAIHMSKYPEIPNSALTIISLQNAEAEALTGIKSFSDGITGNALGDQVGGIRSALDATAKRELGILRRLSKGLVDIARKIIAMNSVWLSDEEIIRISDAEYIAIKRDDLAGNFDLDLTVSTAEENNQKANELSFMLQTMGNTVPFDITKILLVEIAELRKMHKLSQALKEFEPKPDPLAQEKAMLEIELLKAQIANEQAKAGENEVDIALKQAKTHTELAKARNVSSDADIKDLNYIEQGSGIAQDRELEKLRFKNKKVDKQQ